MRADLKNMYYLCTPKTASKIFNAHISPHAMHITLPSFCFRIVMVLAVGIVSPAGTGMLYARQDASAHISVKSPGTLPELLGEGQKYVLTALSIEGRLNGTDLRFLREMAGSDYHRQPTAGRLRTLDLSRATFAPGGEAYIDKDGPQHVAGGPLTLPPFAFRECLLEKIVLPERMDTLGTGAFEYSALRSIRIPEGSVVMGWAFNRCENLEKVEMPQHLAELGQNCFRDCGSLGSLRFHDVEYLPYHAFEEATGLEEIVVDGTLLHVDGWFCHSCPRLRRIEFGGVVLTAGGPPIASNCPQLSEILFSGFAFEIGYGSVENCPLMGRCTVTGAVMGSGNPGFLPSSSEVRLISEPVLQRAADGLRQMVGEKCVSQWAYFWKNGFVRRMAALLTERGMTDEALKMLQLLAEREFPFPAQITSDSAFAPLKSDSRFQAVVERMAQNADFRRMLRLSPPYDTGSLYRRTEPPQRMTFPAAGDSVLQRIRDYFQADYIAGTGSEIERLKNVMFWLHDRIRHRGNFLPASRRSAIDLVEGCRQAGSDGMNARGQAIVLAEIYQALGWPARFITCQSKHYKDDRDATVVTVVWSFTLGKWVMMDASMAAYVTDEDGMLLHPGEIRQRMKDGRPLRLNAEANWNHQESVTQEHYLDYYMAKNLYYMSGFVQNVPGIESQRNPAYYTLVPEGENIKIGIPVYDDAWFWQKPF